MAGSQDDSHPSAGIRHHHPKPAAGRPFAGNRPESRPFRAAICYNPAVQAPRKIIRHRRFQGYDYSRGAVLFITFGLERRRPVFGHVHDSRMIHSAAGLAALEVLQREMLRNPDLAVRSFVIMPDHVHLRIHVRPGAARPLKAVGQFVNNFKRWSKWNVAKLGIALDWQANYHDRLCLSAEVIDLVDKYIDNNPLKWWLMHAPNPALKVHEPISGSRLPDGEWWTGVGNLELISDAARLAAFQLSRTIPRAMFPAVIDRCLSAVDKGYVPASTFISPCERALLDALVAAGAPMVRVVPDPLATVYRPKEDEPPLFAAGKLLLLSRVAAIGLSRSEAWHGINDALADIACANGTAVYVRQDGGRLDWRFRRPEWPALRTVACQ